MTDTIKEIIKTAKRTSSLVNKILNTNALFKEHLKTCSDYAQRLFNLCENETERHAEIKQEMRKSIRRHHAKLAGKMLNKAKKAQATNEKLRKRIKKTLQMIEELRRRIKPATTIDELNKTEAFLRTAERGIAEYDEKIRKDLHDLAGRLASGEEETATLGIDNETLGNIKSQTSIITAAAENMEEALRNTLSRLEQLSTYIQQHDAEVLKEIRKGSTYTLDINSVFRQAGVMKGRTIVLIDTSFIIDVEQERNAQGKNYYDISIPGDEVIIPREVSKEIKRCKSFINYIRKQANLDIGRKVARDQDIDMRIRLAWESTTKGKSATEREKEKFIRSGDAALLHIAFDTVRNRKADKVIILAHDNDINGVVNSWRRNKITRNIHVFMLSNGKLVPHT